MSKLIADLFQDRNTMLSQDDLINAITSGRLFFARLEDNRYLARYTRNGPVELVTPNGLKPLAWQGSDLCWRIRAADSDAID